MDKHTYCYHSEELNREKAQNALLKLLVGVDGVSMLAVGRDGEILGLEAHQMLRKKFDADFFSTELQEFFSNREMLNLPFSRVEAAISVPAVTLVPNRLFSADNLNTYFKLLQDPVANMVFGYEAMENHGCHLVWGADPSFQSFINRFQPKHLASFLIRKYKNRLNDAGKSVFLNVKGNQAQITFFDKSDLLFYNTFEVIKPNDLLYFVLLTYDQFRADPESLPLQVSGSIMEDAEYYKALYRYIGNIRFIEPDQQLNLPQNQDKLPNHFWFDLFAM